MSDNDLFANLSELQKKLKELNDISSYKHSFKSKPKEEYIKQLKINEKLSKKDEKSDFEIHKEEINKEILNEIRYKKKFRNWAVTIFLIISVLLFINLIVSLYWNPLKWDYKVIIALITATFANLFTILALVFTFIFSPTKDMLEYNANLNNNIEPPN